MNVPDGQEALAGDKPGEGDVKRNNCDWCDTPSKHSRELMKRIKGGKAGSKTGTGMFWYACDEHLETLERHVSEPLPSTAKK